MLISEQIVLVTGGGRGLGQALVKAFAREGARIVINYRHSHDAAETLAASIGTERSIAIRADITDPGQVRSMFDKAQTHFGAALTTVINNALANFSFNGDARDDLAAIDWSAFSTQFEGSVRALSVGDGTPTSTTAAANAIANLRIKAAVGVQYVDAAGER